MKLEQQVCSLELAKRLKELGVRQESAFYWNKNEVNKRYIPETVSFGLTDNVWAIPFSAFTAAELGEMLPVEISCHGRPAYKKYWESGDRTLHSVGYEFSDHRNELQEYAKTEADARAAMLIYLLENKLITIQ